MYRKPKRFGRPILTNTAVLTVTTTVAALVLPAQPAVAAEQISCRESASIYTAVTGGDLREYFHNTPESGTKEWSPERVIGRDWSQLTAFTGPGGRLYQIPNNGELRRFRHTGTEWERPGGNWYTTIGTGWEKWLDPAYRNRITVDSKGDFYTIDGSGNLTWSRYDEQAATWTKRVLATGWDKFDMLVAAGDGVIYARENGRANGTLYRTQYHADSQRWVHYLTLVNDGWNMHRRVFSPGADVLYAVQNNTEGTLWWYRWSDTTSTWSEARNLGWGWGEDWQIGAMTNACTLTGLPQPERPAPRPVQNLSRSELIESKNGLIQGFYVDAYGTLKAVTQRDNSPIDFLVTEAIESPTQISTTPSAVMTADGQPTVFALGTTTDTLEATRSTNNISWPKLSSYGGWTTGPAKAVTYTDGRKRLFAIDGQGKLVTRGQHAVDGPVSPWTQVGFDGFSGEVVALATGNDTELLMSDAAGNIVSTLYTNDTVTRIRSVTNSAGQIVGKPAAVLNADGKVQVFARRADGKIHTLRDTASGLETAWTPLDGVTADGAPAAVVSAGRIRVAVRSTDGFIYINSQANTGGPFTGWTKLVDSRSGNAWPSDTEPSMVALSTGKVVVMYRSADEVTYAFESVPAGTTSTAAKSTSTNDRYTGGPSPKPKR